MALVACRECGHQISTTAAACPSCGAPAGVAHTPEPVVNAPAAEASASTPVTARKRDDTKIGVVAILIAACAIAAVNIARQMGEPPKETQAAATPTSTDNGQSTEKSLRAQTLVLVIKKSLGNPDSFTAESVFVTDAGAVCATYRAENSYGGWSRDQAVMSADQAQAINSTHPEFPELWNRECVGKTGLETKVMFKHD